jgi:SAM-dependent methyltransferase
MAPGMERPAGSAGMQGQLWGARARDWAEVEERCHRPQYEAVLARVQMSSGTRVLDIGCGSGVFCGLAAARGASVTGIDAAPALIAIARQRVPQCDFRVGEMEALPYDDGVFDVVTGFNSFQFAATPVNALREARRVARRGAQLAITIWGRPERCETTPILHTLRSFLPPPSPGASGPFALSVEGALETLAADAGLAAQESHDVRCPYEYPDLETALRGLLSVGPAVKAIQTSGEPRVREAVVTALAPFKRADGGYRMENEFRVLIATAK